MIRNLLLVTGLFFFLGTSVAYPRHFEYPKKPMPLAEKTGNRWFPTDETNTLTAGKSSAALEIIEMLNSGEFPLSFDITSLQPTPKTLSQLIWHALHNRYAGDIHLEYKNPVQGWDDHDLEEAVISMTDRIYQCEEEKAVLASLAASPDVSAAPVSYSQAWGGEVVALLNEIKGILNTMNAN